MSGGGNDVGGYIGVGGAGEPCEQVRLTRFLESPQDSVLETLSVGDALAVVLRGESPPLVVALTTSGEEAGGILPTGQLIECLQRGIAFEARVTRINNAAVELDVRAAT